MPAQPGCLYDVTGNIAARHPEQPAIRVLPP